MLLGTLILKIISLILACTFAYQSYVAFKNPKGTSRRPGRVVWGIVSLAISLGLFFYLIDGLRPVAKF
jgi:hypothetical protein